MNRRCARFENEPVETPPSRVGDAAVSVAACRFECVDSVVAVTKAQSGDGFFADRQVFVAGKLDQLRQHIVGRGHGDCQLDSAEPGRERRRVQFLLQVRYGGTIDLAHEGAGGAGGLVIEQIEHRAKADEIELGER